MELVYTPNVSDFYPNLFWWTGCRRDTEEVHGVVWEAV